METEKHVYETKSEILSLAGSGNLCLCDDYRHLILVEGIAYPSVRHAVLSWKTLDTETKKLISETQQPADLKILERSIIQTNNLWSKNFVASLYERYTFEKFEDPNLANALLATHPKKLVAGLMKGQAPFIIDEVATIPNYEGNLLTVVRDYLKQKPFTMQ